MGYKYAGGITLPLITLANEFGDIVKLPSNILDKYLRRLHTGWNGAVDKQLWQHNFNNMLTGLEKGYEIPFAEIKYNHPDWHFIQNLKYNTAVFDAFKSHSQSAKLRELLTDNGKTIPFAEFKKKAAPITGQYNQRWLQTEYNHAHQSALMARKWRDFEANADLYPNLMYVAIMDERTRESHASLNGRVYPLNHSFWNTYYPPLDWNCRCSVRNTNATPDKDLPIDLPELTDGLKINTGKTAKLFDSSHPYYKQADKTTQGKILNFVHQNIRSAEEVEKGYRAFVNHGSNWHKNYFDGNTGGFVVTDNKRLLKSELNKQEAAKFKQEIATASGMANNGEQVFMINEPANKMFYDSKLINGLKVELKATKSSNNIGNYIGQAIQKKANIVVFDFVNFDHKIKRTYNVLKNKYKGRIDVWYLYDGTLYK